MGEDVVAAMKSKRIIWIRNVWRVEYQLVYEGEAIRLLLKNKIAPETKSNQPMLGKHNDEKMAKDRVRWKGMTVVAKGVNGLE